MKQELDTEVTMDEISFWDAAFPFLSSLAKKDCKFLLIGNIASKYHGLRVDKCEVDILVSSEEVDMVLLFEALQEFPWGQGLKREGQLCSFASFYLTIPLHDGSIDIINQSPGLEFEEVYANALNVKFGKLALKVLHRDDLIRNKSLLDDPRHLDEAIELSMLSTYDV